MMEEIYRTFAEELDKCFDRKPRYFDQRSEDREVENKNTRRLAGLQRLAQQPRLTAEADVRPDTKTRERTESVAADDYNYGDISSAKVEENPTSLTNFGNIAEPLAPIKCIGDALVNQGAGAPKQHLQPVEVRMPSSAAGGLLLTGAASTMLRTIFPPPPLSWGFCDKTKKRGDRNNSTTTRRTNFDQIFHWKVIEMK